MQLNIATGLQEYDINGKCKVMFNPTDIAFAKNLFAAIEALDAKTEEYNRMIQAETDEARAFEIVQKTDAAMRAIINGVFGVDLCDPVFGNMYVFALGDGLPVWANLMLAIIDEMDDAFAREKKASDPRIQKYTEKYKR